MLIEHVVLIPLSNVTYAPDRLMDAQKDGQMDEYINRQMDGWIDRWMDG